MTTVIFSREGMDYSRPVSNFVEMFGRKYPGRKIEVQSLDTREGAATATMYDITRYPAIVVRADDGRVVQIWQGEQLPLLDEVAAYALG